MKTTNRRQQFSIYGPFSIAFTSFFQSSQIQNIDTHSGSTYTHTHTHSDTMGTLLIGLYILKVKLTLAL